MVSYHCFNILDPICAPTLRLLYNVYDCFSIHSPREFGNSSKCHVFVPSELTIYYGPMNANLTRNFRLS